MKKSNYPMCRTNGRCWWHSVRSLIYLTLCYATSTCPGSVSDLIAQEIARNQKSPYLLCEIGTQYGLTKSGGWEPYYERRDTSLCVVEQIDHTTFRCEQITASQFAYADGEKPMSVRFDKDAITADNTVKAIHFFDLNRGERLKNGNQGYVAFSYELPNQLFPFFFLPRHEELFRNPAQYQGVEDYPAMKGVKPLFSGTWTYKSRDSSTIELIRVKSVIAAKSATDDFWTSGVYNVEVSAKPLVFHKIQFEGVVLAERIQRVPDDVLLDFFSQLREAEQRFKRSYEKSQVYFQTVLVPLNSEEANALDIPEILKSQIRRLEAPP